MKDSPRKVPHFYDRPLHYLLLAMFLVIGLHLRAGSASAASLSVYDQVRFADPSYWVASYGYDNYHWQPWTAYDTGIQSYAGNNAVSTGRATSGAQYGILGSHVTTSTSGNSVLYSSVSSGASWSDTWTITGPGLTGMGIVNMHYEVEGSMNVVGPGDYIRGWEFWMFCGAWEYKTSGGNTAIWNGTGTCSGDLIIPFGFRKRL